MQRVKGAALIAGAGLAMLLGACGNDPSEEEAALQEERDIAMVKQANDQRPPLTQVTPEPILLPDIERYDLYGEACAYAPGTSLGTRVFAREADAFVKIDGEVNRFAADPGARELPMRTRSLYSGRDFSLRLQIEGKGQAQNAPDREDETAGAPPAGGPGTFEGTVTLFDKYGRVVYEGTGEVQCKSS